MERVFEVPRDQLVKDEADLARWQQSTSHKLLMGFLETCSTAVKGKKISDAPPASPVIERVLTMLEGVERLLEQHPPIAQPQRFGNKAFRSLHASLVANSSSLVAGVLPEHLQTAAVELAPYLMGSFGNPTRLDYGTGHETSFLVLLVCLDRLNLFAADAGDYVNCVLRVFDRFVRLCRSIQRRYSLEPAGSHGVWSLDDYQFIPFLWGSAQLIGNSSSLSPSSVLAKETARRESADYLYCAAIDFIHTTKTGQFFEHSPTLHNISGVATWEKINGGMFKMYSVEVLGKVPIVQHFLFGTLFPKP